MSKYKNLIGQQFGRLYPIEYLGKSKWLCKCSCGEHKVISTSNLISGGTQSCGCLHKEKTSNNLTNKRFGKLIVIKDSGLRTKNRQIIWTCQCECGNIIQVRTNNLTSGNTQSCGCLKQSHGEYKIEQLLINANISYIKEYVFLDLYTERGGHPRFDFAIFDNNQLKYLIEYDGETHAEECSAGWNTIEKIQYQQKCDKLKDEYCQNNNIPLIRIPYTKLNSITLTDLILK